MSDSSAAVAASNAAVATVVAHKHAKPQETVDTVQSCNTYQNLIFEEGTARTETIIVCNIEKPILEKKPDVYTDLTLGIGILLAFILGGIIGMYIGYTGPKNEVSNI